jgi:hypothetical protein
MGRLTASGLVLDHDEVGVHAERDEDQLSVPAYPGFHQVDGMRVYLYSYMAPGP